MQHSFPCLHCHLASFLCLLHLNTYIFLVVTRYRTQYNSPWPGVSKDASFKKSHLEFRIEIDLGGSLCGVCAGIVQQGHIPSCFGLDSHSVSWYFPNPMDSLLTEHIVGNAPVLVLLSVKFCGDMVFSRSPLFSASLQSFSSFTLVRDTVVLFLTYSIFSKVSSKNIIIAKY